MEKIDYILLIPLVLGFIFGLKRGFIREFISIVSIFAGIFGAKLLTPMFADFLHIYLDISQFISKPLAFSIIFISIFIASWFISKFLESLIEAISLGGLNKLFGGFIGLLKYAFIISVFVNIFHVINLKAELLQPSTIKSSLLYNPMLNFGPELWKELKQVDSIKSYSTEIDEFN